MKFKRLNLGELICYVDYSDDYGDKTNKLKNIFSNLPIFGPTTKGMLSQGFLYGDQSDCIELLIINRSSNDFNLMFRIGSFRNNLTDSTVSIEEFLEKTKYEEAKKALLFNLEWFT